MALADHRRRLDRFLPLTHTLSVTAGLLAAKLFAPLAGPIPLGRLPPRPKPRRIHAGRATVPRERMRGRKPLLAPLQETKPRTTMSRDLPPRRRAIMLDMDQGSANSRRSSPGSGASSPLRDALDWSLPARPLPVQLNHAVPALPLVPGVALRPGPHFAAIPPRRTGPLIPRNWPPVTPRLTVRSEFPRNQEGAQRGLALTAGRCFPCAGPRCFFPG